jgi:hypothetical protein
MEEHKVRNAALISTMQSQEAICTEVRNPDTRGFDSFIEFLIMEQFSFIDIRGVADRAARDGNATFSFGDVALADGFQFVPHS